MKRIILLSSVLASEPCDDHFDWQDMGQEAREIVPAWNSLFDVWVISTKKLVDGWFKLSRKSSESTWAWDESQQRGAVSRLAVDFQGNPAFLDYNGRINWKKNGNWDVIEGCATDIAFGGKGHLYKISCMSDGYRVYQYKKGGWKKFPNQTKKALRLTIAPSGIPWIVTWDYKVFRFSYYKWSDMGLDGAKEVTAGPGNEVYALSKNSKIYKFMGENRWNLVDEKEGVQAISIGGNGRIYIRDDKNHTYMSDTLIYTTEYLTEEQMARKKAQCKAELKLTDTMEKLKEAKDEI